MSRFIQPLENRMLLSASNTVLSGDLSTVRTDASSVRNGLTGLHANISADLKTLATYVRALKVSSNNKLLVKLNAADAVGYARTTAAQAGLLATGQSLSALLVADAKLLNAKPSNTKLAAKISTDATNLNTKVAAKVNALQTAETNWQSADDSNVTAITSNNPSSTTVSTEAGIVTTDLSSALASYSAEVRTFQTAISTLATDATA